ncbi:hypothetical protein Q499_0696B, partial [Chlamydia suis MD56]
FVTRLC